MPIRAAFDQGIAPTVDFVNKATVPLGVEFERMVAAMQKYLDDCFAKVWGTPATVAIAPEVRASNWGMVFLDDADEANALGYHDLTRAGMPISKVFVKTTLAAGEKISVTASHELAEMLVDPAIATWVTGPKGILWAYETADACEAEEFDIDGVAMSDFVFPSFFEKFRKPGSGRFDWMGKVAGPFSLLHGGYSIVQARGRESQIFARRPALARPDGTSVIFGSKEAAARFVLEDRRQHRSEAREAPIGGPEPAQA